MLARLRVLQGAATAAAPSRLAPALFLSGAVEAASLHLLRHLGITHILNATEVRHKALLSLQLYVHLETVLSLQLYMRHEALPSLQLCVRLEGRPSAAALCPGPICQLLSTIRQRSAVRSGALGAG